MKSFVTDDGVRLCYSDRGNGKPVILVAGYSAPANSWELQSGPLLKAGYRVIAFDRRSHGKSDKPAAGHTLKRHGQDLNGLIEHLKLEERPVLVGQSMGASAVLAYLDEFGDGAVAGFLDVDQTPRMINGDGWEYGMFGLTRDNFPAFFDGELPRPNFAPIPRSAKIVILKALFLNPKFDREETKPLLVDHGGSDWLETLPKISVPCLFVAGEKSPMWPSGHAEASAKLCRNGSFTVVPECGHAVTWEFPDEFNRIMLDFLSRVWK